MLKILSVHGQGNPNAAWNSWYTHMGIALPETLGKTTHVIDTNQGKWVGGLETGTYTLDLEIKNNFDMAYIQPFIIPTKRPAPFIYSFVSDYQNKRDELKIKKWIENVRPNFIGSLQTISKEFIDFGKKYNCLIKLMPWFMIEKFPYIEKKDITAMCTGVISNSYSNRTRINNYLKNLNRKDIVAVCGSDRTNFELSNEKYEHFISRTKYYMSGAIYDRYIPPKYYEVCNVGACLVSHETFLMKQCGFINGKTYIKINNINDIQHILKDDLKWKEIGKRSQEMIQENHTVDVRAKQIMEIYENICQ